MTAVITGASSGIGYAAAELLYKNGYMVYGVSRSKSGVEFMKEIPADVTDTESLRSALNVIIEESKTIDLLIACAGTGLSSPVERTDMSDARYLFDVNFFGVAETVSFFLPIMKERRGGKIIIISSMAGILPLPYECFYSASKAALCAYAGSLHNEAKLFGISVSAILPGGVRTGFTRKRKRYEELYPMFSGYRKAVETLSREEQTGLYAKQVARDILKLVKRKKPPEVAVSGGIYKLYYMMLRILPLRIILFVLRKKYMGV
ncbi:MAG: SDR family NAD(P)-dependent oxidoreductase [Clostridiales bacterium]|jgi:short-subunit dehydrogenase|nr:SDR family NAD(P)-dependent oxidoreductase [Clostridiales bacterium]